jgi:dolichol-phosphate mannosyltransferase
MSTNPQMNEIQYSIVIPAYNEEVGISLVLEDLINLGLSRPPYEILVVDDGSSDRTANEVSKYDCRLIQHVVNQGKGAAMRTGISHAHGKKAIFVDADNSYPADSIPRLVKLLENYQFVRGTRSIGRDNIPWINRLGNKFFDFSLKLLHSAEGGDVLSGMYGVWIEKLEEMNLDSEGFDIETEIVTKAKAFGLKTATFPIKYTEREGEKKLKIIRDGMKIFYRLLVLALTYNPLVMFVIPGLIIFFLGLLGIFLIMTDIPTLSSLPFAVHTTFMLGVFSIIGLQLTTLGFAIQEAGAAYGLVPQQNRFLERLKPKNTTPRMGTTGSIMFLGGLVGIIFLIANWVSSGMGSFGQSEPLVLFGLLLMGGMQMIISAAFISAIRGLYRQVGDK